MENSVLLAAWRRGTLCSGWTPHVFGSVLVSKDAFALLLRAAYFGHGQQVLALPDHVGDGKCFGNLPGRGPVQIRWVPWAEPERPSENSFGDPRRPQPRLRPTGAPNRGLLGQDYLACCFFLSTIHALAFLDKIISLVAFSCQDYLSVPLAPLTNP